MKKILFAAYSLDVGGIETSLVTLLNYLAKEQYDITLVLEKKQGIFLEKISSNVKIIEYAPSYNKNKVIAKTINLLHRIKFYIKNKNKFDFSCSYATYSLSSSFVARTASKNNAVWVHNEYKELYKENKQYHQFFDNIDIEKFKKIVFVSNSARKNFETEYSNLKERTTYCNNLLDYKNILEKSKQEIKDKKAKCYTFLNVGRHDENQKKLSKLIEAAKILKDQKLKFKIILVGDGKNKKDYIEKIKNYDLEDEIEVVGAKGNPYPYFLISDCIILTSEYEGYPVVYNEAKLLNIPIITTSVSDAKNEIDNRFGVVTKNKDIQSIAECMRQAITKGIDIKEKFVPEEYNKNIMKKINMIIES